MFYRAIFLALSTLTLCGPASWVEAQSSAKRILKSKSAAAAHPTAGERWVNPKDGLEYVWILRSR
jgi:hypothetical protein